MKNKITLIGLASLLAVSLVHAAPIVPRPIAPVRNHARVITRPIAVPRPYVVPRPYRHGVPFVFDVDFGYDGYYAPAYYAPAPAPVVSFEYEPVYYPAYCGPAFYPAPFPEYRVAPIRYPHPGPYQLGHAPIAPRYAPGFRR